MFETVPNIRAYLDAVNDLMNIGTLYNHTAVPRNIRVARFREQEAINDLMNIGTLYDTVSTPHAERLARYNETHTPGSALYQLAEARKVISTIKDSPLPTEHWTYRYSNNEKRKIKIKEGARQFTFNFEIPDEQKEVLYRNLKSVITEFADKLSVSARWLINYKSYGGWESFIINKDTVNMIIEQIDNEQLDRQLIEITDPTNPSESAFHCAIRNIQEINFLDVQAYPNLIAKSRELSRDRRQTRQSDNVQVSQEDAQSILSKLSGHERDLVQQLLNNAMASRGYRSREGQFFKYLNTFPYLNLEKYQIFNEITKREVQILDNENCVVWALKQFGINEETLTAIRQMIGTKHFPQSKFQEIADLFEISFVIRYYEPGENKTRVLKYGSKTNIPVNLVLFDDHYMLDEAIPCTTYFIRHWKEIQSHRLAKKWPLEEQMKIEKYDKKNDKYKKTKRFHMSLMTIIKVLFEEGYFKAIHMGDFLTYSSTLYKQKLAPIDDLTYSEKYCTRLKQPYKRKENTPKKKKLFERNRVIYADFECSTDGVHKAFLICGMTAEGKTYYSWGENCADEFLEWEQIIDGTQIYFHNLSYDINFILNKMDKVQGNPIIKSGRTMSIDCIYKDKRIRFRDSYSIISKKLKMFPGMFHLESGPKEIFPYTYYNSEILKDDNYIGNVKDAMKCLKAEDCKQFKENLKKLNCLWKNNKFDMKSYAVYYCNRDVKILHDGFEMFRNDLLKEFKLDAYDFVSISSIANKLFENEVYYPNKNLFDLAGKPRDYCSRAIYGGRCMVSDNEKQINESDKPIVDFDAVSLYPSAMARLYTVEGKPIVSKNNDPYWLLMHLMEENQSEPTSQHFISGFIIQIKITKVNKPRHFPLIVSNPNIEGNDNEGRSINEPCIMYVDHITLEDLIKYQDIKFEMINGYYWKGKRDFSIRNQIQRLFQLRKQYKDEDNPIQEIIKLILNSIYGRTILKPIETKIVFKNLDDSFKYIDKNYNTIESFEHCYDSDLVKFKKYKPINNHFNFCMLGINVLSMSKRIMNEVMCLAEDLNIKIFYQDTDSLHLYEEDVKILSDKYNEIYQRPLIGKSLGQFHSDFHYITNKDDEDIVAIKSIFCGKKSYIDMLQNKNGDIGFHARMKGITMKSLAKTANEMFPDDVPVECHEYEDGCILFIPKTKGEKYSLYSLYKYLYDGNEVTFDLCDGDPRFEMNNNYSVTTKTTFPRKVKF